MPQNTLLLVHGAWHGSWCWDALLPHLDGIDVVTVDLPSVSDQPGGFGDLAADAAVVRAAIDSVDGPVVVCGHSYGGIPVTQAAVDAANVARLVYLCAFQLDAGESLAGVLNFETPDWQVVDEAGGFVDALHAEKIFYADVDEPLRSESIGKLRHHGLAAFAQPLTRASWHTVPSSYIVCEHDQAIPVAAQEAMAQRADRVLRLASSHSPFLSRPRELADLLRGELAAAHPSDARTSPNS